MSLLLTFSHYVYNLLYSLLCRLAVPASRLHSTESTHTHERDHAFETFPVHRHRKSAPGRRLRQAAKRSPAAAERQTHSCCTEADSTRLGRGKDNFLNVVLKTNRLTRSRRSPPRPSTGIQCPPLPLSNPTRRKSPPKHPTRSRSRSLTPIYPQPRTRPRPRNRTVSNAPPPPLPPPPTRKPLHHPSSAPAPPPPPLRPHPTADDDSSRARPSFQSPTKPSRR